MDARFRRILVALSQFAPAQLRAALTVEMRAAPVLLPVLPVGVTAVAVTWSAPFKDTIYGVFLTIVTDAATAGQLIACVESGSQTPNGFTLQAANISGAQISAGRRVQCVGIHL